MLVQEFGQRSPDVILHFHGGGQSWWHFREVAKLLQRAIPGSSMEILPGMRHGDLSINNPQSYTQILTNWIGR